MTAAALTVYNCSYVFPETSRSRLDGDTFRCGGNVSPIIPDSQAWIPKVRLARINAPESGTSGAEEARAALIEWLVRRPFNLICFTRDKYGRLLGDAEAGEGLLSQFMLDRKLAVPMSLQKAKELAPDVSLPLLRSIIYVAEEK